MKITGRLKNSILFKNALVYTILQFINKGIPFLLMPILTRYLSSDAYGMVATFRTFGSFLVVFIGLSAPGAVGVSYFHLEKDQLQRYIGNVFNILIISTLLVTLIVAVFHELITHNVKLPREWMFVAVVVALMQNITNINLTLWRTQQRSKPFALYELSATIVNMAISLLLVVYLGYGWEGRTTGAAVTEIFFGLLSIFLIYKRGYALPNYSIKYIKDALRFGISLIPHALAQWMRGGVDILLITSIIGLQDAGLYSVGYTLGSVVGILGMSFNNAYSPYLYKKLKNVTEEHKIKIVKFTYLYFVGIIFFAVLVSAFFACILPYFLGTSFQEANRYIIWSAIASAFNGMYLMVVNYIFYVKKTHLLSMATVSISFIHAVMSYTFINVYGAIGASYALVISYLLNFLIVWRLSAKVYNMPWFLNKNRMLVE